MPAKLKEHQKLQIGDALISLTGNVGRVCLVDEQKCLLNQRVSKIVGKSSPYTIWGYYYFRQPHMIDKLTHLSKGTAQLNLSPVETLKETIRIPKHERFVDFFNTIIPNHEKLISNKVQVRSLNRMRDTILPKLMSGEVRVKLD
jgi:type I restriction enzyme S subunit